MQRLAGLVACNPLRVTAIGVHHPYLESGIDSLRPRRIWTGRSIGYLLAIWRPGWRQAGSRRIGQSALSATVGIHDVDRRPACAVGGEDDLAPVRRPGGFAIPARTISQTREPAPVDRHHVHIGVAVDLALEDQAAAELVRRWRSAGHQPKRSQQANQQDFEDCFDHGP